MTAESFFAIRMTDDEQIYGVDTDSVHLRQKLRQALWDVYRELGFDADGDDHFHGPDGALCELLVEAAREQRADHDKAFTDLSNAVDVVKAEGYRVVKLQPVRPSVDDYVFPASDGLHVILGEL